MKKRWIFLEVAGFFMMLMAILWIVPDNQLLSVSLVIPTWMFISWRLHGDNWESLGLIKETLPFWTIISVSLVILYIITNFIDPEALTKEHLWRGLILHHGYFFWTIAQELILQSYIVNRLGKCFQRKWPAALTGGTLFAIAHLPNPVLTIGSFFLGIGTAYFFLKLRNLYVIAAAHTLLGGIFLHFIALNLHINGSEIGPYYWR